jgi:hypothetical protein
MWELLKVEAKFRLLALWGIEKVELVCDPLVLQGLDLRDREVATGDILRNVHREDRVLSRPPGITLTIYTLASSSNEIW